MKKDSSSKTRKDSLHYLAGLALVLSLAACSDDTFSASNGGVGGAPNYNTSDQTGGAETAQSGGTSSTGDEATGGLISNGGSSETTNQVSTGGASEVSTGGAAQVNTSTGGASEVSTGGAAQVSTGGAAQVGAGGASEVSTGGAAQVGTGGASEVSTGGAAQANTGGASEVSTGGAAQVGTGGAAQVSTGGAAEVATGGATQVTSTSPEEPLCFDESGAAVPYDFSIGLMGEYAFELSMSCEVGGYLMPLVMADPEQLSEVNAFVATATDWYRADILNCKDETTQLDQNSYGLLPVSQSTDLSDADFDASLALFSMVLDRHDGQPDAVSPEKKGKIKNRIKSVKARAVHGAAAGLTKTLTQPDCVPAAGSGG